MIPETGIGLLYLPGLENLIESFSKELDLIELEPQTTWYKENLETDSFRFDLPTANWLKSLGKPITFHGVGFPIGGTIKADTNHFTTLREHLRFLNPLYISEHLSFNKFINDDGSCSQASFLLPIAQNQNGITTAVENIKHYKDNIHIPFAFETGVNYFKPFPNEIPDGQFFREVAERSEAHILLDIHNLLTNEINGRQKIMEVIRQLPLERVIEIHLGGGQYYKNYYLDAHSDISSQRLLEITSEIVKLLPNLKVILFEMIPEYYQRTISDAKVKEQIDAMKRIWDDRGKKCKQKLRRPDSSYVADESISSSQWERSIGSLVNQIPVAENKITNIISADGGLQIIRDLIYQFRASSIVSALKISCRYIRLMTDNGTLNGLLEEYCANNSPEIFGFANGERFAKFIKTKNLDISFLNEIVDFELAAMQSTIDGEKRTVDLSFEPFALLDALTRFEQPKLASEKNVVYQIELTTDSLFDAASFMKLEPVFHN